MVLYDYFGRHTPLNALIVSSRCYSRVGHDALAWPVRLMQLARGSVVECCSDVTFDVTRRVMLVCRFWAPLECPVRLCFVFHQVDIIRAGSCWLTSQRQPRLQERLPNLFRLF